jgi:uncharacterized protein with HEPN domain
MRNRLFRGYYDVDLDLVWSTLAGELSPLVEELGRMLSETAP